MRRLAFLIVAGWGAALPAQPPALQERIDELIEALGKDDGAWEAAEQLERLGGLALADLVRAADQQAAYVEQGTRKQNALWVIGRLGPQAVPALPALLEIFRFEDRGVFWKQSLWAISEVAPFAGEELRRRARDLLAGSRSFLPDLRTAVQRIDWGPEPPPGEVEKALASGEPALVLAAARTVACGMLPADGRMRRALANAVREAWPAPDRNPWDPLPATYGVLADLARAALAVGVESADVREAALAALLWVVDPLERSRAVASLDAMQQLGVHAILQLVGRLVEPDDALRLQVVKALARRSIQAAFHPFQELEKTDPSDAVREACRAALAEIDVPEPEDEDARRARVRARLQGAVWFGGKQQPIARLLARLAEVGDERDWTLALRLVGVLEESDARAALRVVGALAPSRLLDDGKLEQKLTSALMHRRGGHALLRDAERCVAAAWTRRDVALRRLLQALDHSSIAVRFAALVALAERVDGNAGPEIRGALEACARRLPDSVTWRPEWTARSWFTTPNEGLRELEIAAVAAGSLTGAAGAEEEAWIERLARFRDEDPAATREWLDDREAVLTWMRELRSEAVR